MEWSEGCCEEVKDANTSDIADHMLISVSEGCGDRVLLSRARLLLGRWYWSQDMAHVARDRARYNVNRLAQEAPASELSTRASSTDLPFASPSGLARAFSTLPAPPPVSQCALLLHLAHLPIRRSHPQAHQTDL
jgi:hypothetical protein